MTDPVDVRIDGCVTTIILNRPHVLNAIDTDMHMALERAFDAFALDDHQRICIVTGAGDRAFCAGTDLRHAFNTNMAKSPYPLHGYAGLIERYDLDKPVIAAVNGLALGGGFEIALACDVVLADPNAKFGLPEPRVGAVPLGGGIHRLARQIGLKQAMGLLLGSHQVSAADGLRMGFVTEVAEQGGLDALVERWTRNILAGAPLAMRAIKQAAMRGHDEQDFATAMKAQHLYPAWQAWDQSPEPGEGVTAFVQKRQPTWQDPRQPLEQVGNHEDARQTIPCPSSAG